MQDDDDLLFLNEVPVANSDKKQEISDIYNEFVKECNDKGYDIFDSSDDNKSTRNRENILHYKSIALCKKDVGKYSYVFGKKDDEYNDYYDYMKKRFEFEIKDVIVCDNDSKKIGKVHEVYKGNDYFRTIVVKNCKGEIFIGIHIPSESKYENMLIKSYFHNLNLLIIDIKAKYGADCKIVCSGDTNIYKETNPNYDELVQFLKNNKLVDSWTKDNRHKNDDKKGMTSSYNKNGKKGKNRIDRIFISDSIKAGYKFYVNNQDVEDSNYNVEHKDFIVDEKLGLELSDHYPISIEFKE